MDLSDPGLLRDIEAASLTLLFRFIFTLYAEAAGFLPVDSYAYAPDSATELAATARRNLEHADRRSSRLWDKLTALMRMIRTGNKSSGVAAYNGSLFLATGFPGSELLERAQVRDPYMARALTSIAYASDNPDDPGLDYAELEIGHLGAIYEGLLGLRLSQAREHMKYDARLDRYLPARSGDTEIVQRSELFYQSEKGSRKAEGVFYTRQEFVRHLIQHSLVPALEDHLDSIRKQAESQPARAADLLVDFKVLDPAMGSAHFWSMR